MMVDADLEQDTEGEGEGDHHHQPGDAEEDPPQEPQPSLPGLGLRAGCTKYKSDDANLLLEFIIGPKQPL